MEERHRKGMKANLLVVSLLFVLLAILAPLVAAAPVAPDAINVTANETKGAVANKFVNISGGYIATLNLTAAVQNPRWKGFVGWIDGRFTLQDASGSTLYDWTLASITGEIYATRASGTITWANIGCADTANVTAEDTAMEHNSSVSDSINSTFTYNGNAKTFVTAGNTITAGTCYATNTYVNNATQALRFEEVILSDYTNIVFTTVLEQDQTGFDGNAYDFQMIVPENGNETFTSKTAYYLYVELS